MSDVVAVALITVTGSTLVTIVALIVAARQARTARTLDLKKQKRHFDATRQKDDLTELRQLCDEALKTMNSVETMNPVEETPAGGASAGLSEGPNQLAQLRGHASMVGWPGALQPPAPSDPGVTVSRHRALLTSSVGLRSREPISSGRRGSALVRAVRSTIARTVGRPAVAADTSSLPSASGRC